MGNSYFDYKKRQTRYEWRKATDLETDTSAPIHRRGALRDLIRAVNMNAEDMLKDYGRY